MLCGVAKLLKVQHFLVVYNGEGQVLNICEFFGGQMNTESKLGGPAGESICAVVSLEMVAAQAVVLICNNLVASSLWHRMRIL